MEQRCGNFRAYTIYEIYVKCWQFIVLSRVQHYLSLFLRRFYGPINPMGSCCAWSVYLTILLRGRPRSPSGHPVLCTFFRQKLTTAFLNRRKGENDCRKYFMIKSPRKNVADLQGVGHTTSWSPVGRTSNWATEAKKMKGDNKRLCAMKCCLVMSWTLPLAGLKSETLCPK